MPTKKEIQYEEDAEKVRQAVVAAGGGPLGRGHMITALQRLPIGWRRIQRICRERAESWGFVYTGAQYSKSGAGPFGRYGGGKRGIYHTPYIHKKRS